MTVSRSYQLKETPDEGNEKLIIIVSVIKFIAVTSWRNHQQKKKITDSHLKYVFFIFPCVLLPF